MPLIFIALGSVLVISGLKGDPTSLFALVVNDFEGPNNYLYWVLSIVILGSLGYVDELKQFSRLFLFLILVVLLLHDKGGFFVRFQQFVNASQSSNGTVQNG